MLKLTYIALILNLVLSFSLLSDQSCKVFRNITAEALQQEEEFRQQTKWELYGLCANIKDLSQNLSSEISLENLKNHILDKIEHDELLLAEMMVVSQNMPDRTWSFKTNKNLLLLAGAKELIENGFEDLLGCKLGETQKYDFEKITWLGESLDNNLTGRGEVLHLKTALIYMYLGLKWADNISSYFDYAPFLESGMVHATPMPEAFNKLPLNETYLDLTLRYENQLAFVHGGYAFGGQRRDVANNKRFGPEDCSSWVAKLLGVDPDVSVSTYDFINLYHHVLERPSFVDTERLESRGYQELNAFIKPIEINSIGDIRQGDIYAYRRFDLEEDPEKTKTLGRGGHVGLVIGVDIENNEVIILNYNRDIENQNKEGFGLERKSFSMPENTKQLFFRLK